MSVVAGVVSPPARGFHRVRQRRECRPQDQAAAVWEIVVIVIAYICNELNDSLSAHKTVG